MKMIDIIQKVSEVYREEREKISKLQKELTNISNSLEEVERTNGENITYAEYNSLVERKYVIIKHINTKEYYCEGISRVREMLMDLGFDTDINM